MLVVIGGVRKGTCESRGVPKAGCETQMFGVFLGGWGGDFLFLFCLSLLLDRCTYGRKSFLAIFYFTLWQLFGVKLCKSLKNFTLVCALLKQSSFFGY